MQRGPKFIVFLISVSLAMALCSAAEPRGPKEVAVIRLTATPDLSPHLSSEEVDRVFSPLAQKFKEVGEGWRPELVPELTKARDTLAPRFNGTTKLTIFSLYPWALEKYRERPELEKLPRFHGRPIYGSVVIDQPAEAKRWVGFIQSHVVPGPGFACGFEPRHGFRFETAKGNVDVLMCFHCGDIAVFPPAKNKRSGKNEMSLNPIFSPVVMELVNALLDKEHIERDLPQKR